MEVEFWSHQKSIMKDNGQEVSRMATDTIKINLHLKSIWVLSKMESNREKVD